MRIIATAALLTTFFCSRYALSQVRTQNRPSAPLFTGSQGPQRTEVRYDAGAKTVTVKVVVQDSNGYFIQNIRRESFAVYEDGVRQNNASVTVEHAPVSMAILIEYGGRNPSLNRELAAEVSRCANQMLDTLSNQDSASIWTYADSVTILKDFTRDLSDPKSTMLTLQPPEPSETNLYDAVMFAIDHMRPIAGRKALLLISSGADTFSKAKYEDSLKAARQSDAPVYAISLVRALSEAAQIRGVSASSNDGRASEKKLENIARQSGGRLYSPENTINLSGPYGDIVENLKVRYVITYLTSSTRDPSLPRTVRVELVEAGTAKPLRILDAAGHPVRANVIAEGTYSAAQRLSKGVR